MASRHDYDLRAYTKGQVWYMEDNTFLSAEASQSYMTTGCRPVLIYSAVNCAAHYVTAIPLTTKLDYKNGVKLNLGRESTLLIHEIQPVPIKSLTKFLGTIWPNKMEEIDTAVKIYFGLLYDEELKDKYFHQTNNIRNSDMIYDDQYPPASTKQKQVVEHKYVQIPLDDKEDEEKPKKEHKKYTKIDVRTLSDSEKEFILTADTKTVVERYGISKQTVYNYRTTLKHMKNMETVKK